MQALLAQLPGCGIHLKDTETEGARRLCRFLHGHSLKVESIALGISREVKRYAGRPRSSSDRVSIFRLSDLPVHTQIIRRKCTVHGRASCAAADSPHTP